MIMIIFQLKFLKKINSPVSKVLSGLINHAYDESKYPNSLRLAKVIPIFKSGSKNYKVTID